MRTLSTISLVVAIATFIIMVGNLAFGAFYPILFATFFMSGFMAVSIHFIDYYIKSR